VHANHTICAIQVHRLDVPLSEPFVISLETITAAQNVLVEIQTYSGFIGRGECCPYRSIAGETQDTCIAVASLLAKNLEGRNALDTENNLVAIHQAIWGNYAIKSAFDIALFDLAAQIADMPLYAFLGGSNDKSLVTDMTVGLDSPEIMARQACRFVEQGFTAIKVKLGTNLHDDVNRITRIREALGNDSIKLRVDANQGWDQLTAIRTLQAIAPFDIDFCEQPVSRKDDEALGAVRRQSPIPIMADEALGDHFDALRLVKNQACDLFNIKLAKSGGIRNALQITAIAEAAGIPCQIGCFSESRLGMTAFAHIALARNNIVYHDLDCALMLSADPVEGGARYGPNGTISVPDSPGLGITHVHI
jgi:L-alanine-DL-glutamate epimerase-like enolase superfamily enzyme